MQDDWSISHKGTRAEYANLHHIPYRVWWMSDPIIISPSHQSPKFLSCQVDPLSKIRLNDLIESYSLRIGPTGACEL